MVKSKCKFCKKEIIRGGTISGIFCSLSCKGKWQMTQKPVDKEWLEQKYVIEKLSTYDIAKIVKRDPKGVYCWLKGYGIPTRKRGDNLINNGIDNYGNKIKLGIVDNPFKGKTHSEKTKKLLSEKASCPKPYLRGNKNGMYGKKGRLSPSWRGGLTPLRQKMYSNSKWKKAALQAWKDCEGKCVICEGKGEELHHKLCFSLFPEFALDTENLFVVCKKCHKKLTAIDRKTYRVNNLEEFRNALVEIYHKKT